MGMYNDSKSKNFIVLTTGGTGGHIFTAQAIADKLKANNYQLHLICDKRVLSLLGGSFLKIPKSVIIAPAPKTSIFSKLITICVLLFDTLKVFWIFLKNRPKLVLSFGGYPTLPALLSGVILRIPLILHEQNALLGQINRIFLPYVNKLFTSFPHTRKIKNCYKDKVIMTGLPLRGKVIKSTKKTNAKKDNEFLKIMVIGGSQGTKLFSDIVPRAILALNKDLQKKIQITQQVRNNQIKDINEIYKKTHCKYRIKSFFKNIHELYQEHDLIIARAGGASIAELFSFQKACIIVPLRKAKDNHQYYNAKFLSDNSKSIMIDEVNFNAVLLSDNLKKFLVNSMMIQNMANSYNPKYSLMHLNASSTILSFLSHVHWL